MYRKLQFLYGDIRETIKTGKGIKISVSRKYGQISVNYAFFFLNYEKLKYWLYQEDVYEELHIHEYFKDYTMEQCQQDLTSLVAWKNLVTIQDTRKVSSIEEFKNKKFRYQLSEISFLVNFGFGGISNPPYSATYVSKYILRV